MVKSSILSDSDIYSIQKLVKNTRNNFRIGDAPLGNNIFKLAESEGIRLVFYPIKNNSSKKAFSSVYVSIKSDNTYFQFIGVNTNRYLDTQIFGVAHELYHHNQKSSLHFYRYVNEVINKDEAMAERFAAELLLPFTTLDEEIKSVNNGIRSIKDWEYKSILMFIARLHCDYKLPYKAVVKRLMEVEAISNQQYEKLIEENGRDKEGIYYTIGLSIGGREFEELNKCTQETGIYKSELEKIIRDYDNGLIDLAQLDNSMSILGRSLKDFGLQENVDMAELEEFNYIFQEFEDEKE
jgi:Zn-dependent peptidase ImmA (M78 family)